MRTTHEPLTAATAPPTKRAPYLPTPFLTSIIIIIDIPVNFFLVSNHLHACGTGLVRTREATGRGRMARRAGARDCFEGLGLEVADHLHACGTGLVRTRALLS